MSFGVSTACLYPQNTEDALEELGKLGVKPCEIFLNSPSETSPEFARILREIDEKYAVYRYHSPQAHNGRGGQPVRRGNGGERCVKGGFGKTYIRRYYGTFQQRRLA